MLRRFTCLPILAVALCGPAIASIRQWVEARSAHANSAALVNEQSAEKVDAQAGEPVTVVDKPPKHPTESAKGPKLTAIGIIRNVVCSYPAVIEFRVVNPRKTISVYNNNFSKLDLTVLGFTPQGDMNPCKDFEGMKARVQYVVSSDKTINGQVIAVELRK